MSEYLYAAKSNKAKSDRAVIVLPEIFGMNKFIKDTTDSLAEKLQVNAYALDHFYAVTGESQVYGYDNYDETIATMQQMTGAKFVDLFTTALEEIDSNNVSVVGFCFGGKLAYLSGVKPEVSKIASFYGAGSVADGFYQGLSAIDVLAQARKNDSKLKITGFYGSDDDSISQSDREQISTTLASALIAYREKVYAAGHAFMNFERADRYDPAASQEAWTDLIEFLK